MYNPTHLSNNQQFAAHAVILHLLDALHYIRQHRQQDAYGSLLDAGYHAQWLPIAEHTRALMMCNALRSLLGRAPIAPGVRIARDMMHEQDAMARNAAKENRGSDADAHAAASRALFAISSTSGDVSAEIAFRWASEEREAQRAFPAESQEALESGYTATILEMLAIKIRGRA